MSENNNTVSTSSLAPLLLTLLFTGLKLGEVGKVADWSWFWVVSPLWISACLGVTIVMLAVLIHIASRR